MSIAPVIGQFSFSAASCLFSLAFFSCASRRRFFFAAAACFAAVPCPGALPVPGEVAGAWPVIEKSSATSETARAAAERIVGVLDMVSPGFDGDVGEALA